MSESAKAKPKTKAELAEILNSEAEVTKIAKAFGAELLKEIGAAKMKKVIADNKAEKDDNVCHSQDHCDANMVMDDAFKSYGIDIFKDYPGFPGKGMTGKDNATKTLIELWNKVWDEAKSNNFYFES
jgi:hypothetical protein